MGWAARGEREGSEDEGMSGKWGGQQEGKGREVKTRVCLGNGVGSKRGKGGK